MVSEHRSEGGGTAAHPNTTGESVGPGRGEAVTEHDDCEWEAQGKLWQAMCESANANAARCDSEEAPSPFLNYILPRPCAFPASSRM